MKKNKKDYQSDQDYYKIIKDILEHEEFQKRKEYQHHGKISVYDHSLSVSYLAYKISKKINIIDSESVAIGGLLHDFYYEPWQTRTDKQPLLKKHGFVHANEALQNSKKYFPNHMNQKIENIIERHMFPLNKVPPKYKEAWLIVLIDKWISLEALKEPTFFKSIIGIKENKEKKTNGKRKIRIIKELPNKIFKKK